MLLLKKIIISILIVILSFSMAACNLDIIPYPSNSNQPVYNLVYSGNENISGNAPAGGEYQSATIITVSDNIDNLARDNYTFDGWNSQADGQGTDYAVGSTFTITANKLLYAKWVNENSLPRHATLRQVNIKPVEVDPPSNSVPVMHVEFWDDVKLNNFIMTFGEFGAELPSYSFKEEFNFEMGVQIYEIEDVDYINLPMNVYTEFLVDSNANYFKRLISTTDTLSFKASFFISNFAKPVYSNPEIVTSVGSVGGSTLPLFEETDYPVPVGVTELTIEFNDQVLTACGFINYSVQFVFDITRGTLPIEDLYNVTYDGNGASANIPVDNIDYYSDSTAMVKQQGSMVYSGFLFTGWNTQSDGSGTDYNGNDTIIMTNNITLYAQWEGLATASIKGKMLKDAELNSSPYVQGSSIYLTGNYEYGITAYLYLDYDIHPTIRISDFVTFEILPVGAVVTYEYLKDSTPIGYNDAFAVPSTTSSQVNIQVKVMQGTTILDAVMIYIRKLPV